MAGRAGGLEHVEKTKHAPSIGKHITKITKNTKNTKNTEIAKPDVLGGMPLRTCRQARLFAEGHVPSPMNMLPLSESVK